MPTQHGLRTVLWHIAKDMMLDDFQDFDAFKQAATLGRTADESVDFGIR
ncbi:Uncharacterised protein [Bifidobacterium bifidum]|nr:Uncharacterised protein [Bifidobacterium bifidum]